ncbi:MAG: Gfo/Idh/MocA family protein [Bosea sp. (in: a-proteobacteria)]
MTAPVALAVVGAGLIGQRHMIHILAEPTARLHAVVDPSSAGQEAAAKVNAAWYPDIEAMLAAGRPDGMVIATPNQLHVAHGLQAIEAGIAVLVEKPLADEIAGAERLVAAAEAAKVPLLTGHHRRHNPMIARAKAIIDSGRLGRLVSVHAFFWLMKPDAYFETPWRREAGAGPVLLNLSHDVDLLRHLCGEVQAVQAFQSNAVRGHAVDETTVVIVTFANGALGTLNISDTIVAPWSWEQTTGENPAYPHTDQICYHLGGTHGSLSVPRLELWRNIDARGWWEPFVVERLIAPDEDPLLRQIQHFCRVIREGEAPLVSGREGLQTLRVIDAIQRAARDGQKVVLQ